MSEVLLLERTADGGKKIIISGGGRCNVTHDVVEPDDFNGNRICRAHDLSQR